jgi:hypothetical protein
MLSDYHVQYHSDILIKIKTASLLKGLEVGSSILRNWSLPEKVSVRLLRLFELREDAFSC